jgi:hypothetical protein
LAALAAILIGVTFVKNKLLTENLPKTANYKEHETMKRATATNLAISTLEVTSAIGTSLLVSLGLLP